MVSLKIGRHGKLKISCVFYSSIELLLEDIKRKFDLRGKQSLPFAASQSQNNFPNLFLEIVYGKYQEFEHAMHERSPNWTTAKYFMEQTLGLD